MLRQKDMDARWTQKHGKNHFGYKSHISIDRKHKIIRHFEVTPATTHDSQVFKVLLDERNTSSDVWADSAYLSARQEAALRRRYRSHNNNKGSAKKPISVCQENANHNRMDEIETEKTIVTMCPHSDRAEISRLYLTMQGYHLCYLTDGMLGLANYFRSDTVRYHMSFIEE